MRVLASAQKTTSVRMFGFDNVMVPILNKFGFVAKNISSFSSMIFFVYDSLHQILTQQNLKMFSITIQSFVTTMVHILPLPSKVIMLFPQS
jgi:hypothetical protein